MPNRISNHSWITVSICIFLLAIVWLVFGQTLGHDFINYDDDVYVYDNPRVMSGITAQGLKSAFTRSHGYNWHPLTTVSHMLDCQIYGAKAGGHHFTNVALHSIAVLLLFLVLRQMTGALWRSAFVAALFAIHPLHVESVAWIAERKDVLSAVFFMLSLGAYARYVRKPTVMHYVTMSILFACGLMSKPMLVTLPFVFLLLDYWPLGRFNVSAASAKTAKGVSWWDRQSNPARLVLEKLPLFALAAASSIVTILIQRHGVTSFERLPLSLRIYNASVSEITYIRQMIWPWPLAPFYPYPLGSLSIWVSTFAIAALAVITCDAWVLRKKHPYFITGWFWYLGMLVPVIGLFQVGLQGHADRYSYLPHIGLYVLVTWAFSSLAARWPHRFAISGVTAAAVIIALGFSAWKQTSHWKNSETLWTHTLAVTSRNDIAHHNLGEIFSQRGELQEAVANFREAIEIRPENAKAHASLATALMREGNTNEAFLHWQESLRLEPGNVNARDNLGVALALQGRTREAMAQWEQSLKYDGDDGSAQNKLAWVLATAPDPSLRDGDRAVQLAERVLQLSGYKKAVVFQTLAAAYAETGRFSAAIDTAKRGLQLATEQKNFTLVDDLKQNIILFETSVPVRDKSLGD
jgi:cytochrome c-type biogenesis protein CcmH/NrfG